MYASPFRHAPWPDETLMCSSSTCTGTVWTCLGCWVTSKHPSSRSKVSSQHTVGGQGVSRCLQWFSYKALQLTNYCVYDSVFHFKHTVHAVFLRVSFYQLLSFWLLPQEAYLNTAVLATGEVYVSFLFVGLVCNLSSVLTSSGEVWHHMTVFLTRVVVAATDPLRFSLAQFVVCSVSAPPTPPHPLSVLFCSVPWFNDSRTWKQ